MREFLDKLLTADNAMRAMILFFILFALTMFTLMINDAIDGDLSFGGSSSDCEWNMISGSCN